MPLDDLIIRRLGGHIVMLFGVVNSDIVCIASELGSNRWVSPVGHWGHGKSQHKAKPGSNCRANEFLETSIFEVRGER